ncbi:MAG: hypothetical protein E7137_05595 [Rikenellaceae bacterium]|nr:hypothetical protein [Rikenellaceae bacterium]
MSFIENPKTYTGHDLETIFFRPMLAGPSAQELGVRILYNMPTPTTVQLWEAQSNVLQKYSSAGWSGGTAATKAQKTIALERVKAELGFAAADYFSMVYELIVGRSDVNLDDLSGTELEAAETELFKRAIGEGIRATMWVGDTSIEEGFNTFNGFLTLMSQYIEGGAVTPYHYAATLLENPEGAVELFDQVWEQADERLKDLKSEGQLAMFVTSDIYHLYEKYLDSKGAESAYTELVNGRPALAYHGIPIIDLHISSYLKESLLPQSLCLLTDRRNLVLAVNTADFPGTEVRMWYNPDLMENRQRATFMAGCEILDERIVSLAQIRA